MICPGHLTFPLMITFLCLKSFAEDDALPKGQDAMHHSALSKIGEIMIMESYRVSISQFMSHFDAGVMTLLEEACYESEKGGQQPCRALEYGSGAGAYVTYLKKHKQRHIVGFESHPIAGGVVLPNAPLHTTTNILSYTADAFPKIVKGPYKRAKKQALATSWNLHSVVFKVVIVCYRNWGPV